MKEHIGVAEMLGDNRKRLILIDDHILVRQGLERLLNLGDKFVVCEETGDEVVLMKDSAGHVIGFEKLNFSIPDADRLRVALETTPA